MIIRTIPDKQYDLVQIAERFTVPYYFNPEYAKTPTQHAKALDALKRKAAEVVKFAVWKYERLQHWQWKTNLPVELDFSQAQYDLDIFAAGPGKGQLAVNQGQLLDKLCDVAYVVKLWFIQPKIRVEVITPEPTDPAVTDGFVNPYKMPAFVELEDSKYRQGEVDINA